MFIELIIKIQMIARDINPTLISEINEKNKTVINEHIFRIDLVRPFNRGLFSVSAGANNIVAIKDTEHIIAINKKLKL